MFNAEQDATAFRWHGHPQTASDQVIGALGDLWEIAPTLGYSSAQISDIAERWVEWDEAGEPWPRSFPANIVALRDRK